MNWRGGVGLQAVVGYRSPVKELSLPFNGVSRSKPFAFDAVIGNTNKNGQWIFRLANNIDNNAAECYAWYSKQPSQPFVNGFINSDTDCPCSLTQIFRDFRFRRAASLNFNGKGLMCWNSRTLHIYIDTSISFFSKCCYDPEDGALVTEINPDSGIPTTQIYVSTEYSSSLLTMRGWLGWLGRRFRRLAVKDALAADKTAFTYCCVNSQLSRLYEEKRRISTCQDYSPPRLCK